MLKYLLCTVFLGACTPQVQKAIEDGVEGEIKVVEQVIEDLNTIQPNKPSK